MLTFTPINSDNVLEALPYFKYKISRNSDYTIGAIYMWRDFYESSYAIFDNMLLYKVKFYGRTSFTFPIGTGSLDKVIIELKEYCRMNGIQLWFCTVPDEAVPILTKQHNGKMTCDPNRDWSDYLYASEDLANMEGRRFSGQRNHINKFKKLYPDYRYIRINQNNVSRVIDFLLDYQVKFSKDSDLAKEELNRSLELMPYVMKFNLPGGFLEVNGDIVAMSVGEIINDTLYSHIEKANREYQGSYQMIVKEFSKDFCTPQVKYINREEDVGDEGLRTSKLSYHPVQLLNKYCILMPQ